MTYESSDSCEPMHKLKDDKDLFIGKFDGSPCVIRRYKTSKDSDVTKFLRDIKALKTKKNLHENFIRYFDQVKDGDYT